jgi:hypothetical protein
MGAFIETIASTSLFFLDDSMSTLKSFFSIILHRRSSTHSRPFRSLKIFFTNFYSSLGHAPFSWPAQAPSLSHMRWLGHYHTETHPHLLYFSNCAKFSSLPCHIFNTHFLWRCRDSSLRSHTQTSQILPYSLYKPCPFCVRLRHLRYMVRSINFYRSSSSMLRARSE